MTLLVAFVLANAAALPAADPDPIVVLAEKLKRIRVTPGVRFRNGVMTQGKCKITRSSGDLELDRLTCDAVRTCAERVQSSRSDFNACVKKEAEAAIDRVVEARRQLAVSE